MYKIKSSAIPYLEENGFTFKGDGFYVLRFPIYFYKDTPLIFCVATINLEYGKKIRIDVEKGGNPYASWYLYQDQLSPKFLNKLNMAIDKKMHKIGARHYAD